MAYHGIEIYFQSLGNADSIFVRQWDCGRATNILIDGGCAGHIEQVEEFLEERSRESGDRTIHYLVCSHSHDDHAGGLVKLVENRNFPIRQAWVHDAGGTMQAMLGRYAPMLKSTANRLLQELQKSEITRIELIEALNSSQIPVFAPFAGNQLAPGVFVLGPSPEFLTAQYQRLSNPDNARALNEHLKRRDWQIIFETDAEQASWARADDQKGLGTDPTSPENEVSTVLGLVWDGEVHLLTGDVGCEGLQSAIDNTRNWINISNVASMQIPHHGSRRNMNEGLVQYFSPRSSYISCAGTHKHPSRKLVNALKNQGSSVFTTHYSVSAGFALRHHVGNVPPATEPAVPLYE